MRAENGKAFLKKYLHSAWMPSALLILCGAIPVLATIYARGILSGEKEPSVFLVKVITALLYTALVPMAVTSLGLLMTGVYQTLNAYWFKGLINLVFSIVLNLAIFVLFLRGYIALP